MEEEKKWEEILDKQLPQLPLAKVQCDVRDVFRKKRYYVGKIPPWADPPPHPPSMGIFSTKSRFFLKMSQSEKIKKIVNYVLAPQDDFDMQKKT